MKKVMALLLCGVLLFAFAGCGKAEKKSNTKNNSTSSETGKTENTKDKVTKTELYKDADLSEYVTLCDYKLTLKDGIVETGDVANIDYTGKKNGVAFEGGTAQGYNLTIGSGTFIPGFEDGLVGVKVGATVDLDLTFPENYGSEELAGAAVVFTVKVNSIEKPLIKKYSDGCTIKSYPKNDMADALSLANVTDYYYTTTQGASLKQLLEYNNMKYNDFMTDTMSNEQAIASLEEMKKDENLATVIEQQLVSYALFQKEGLSYDASKLSGLEKYERYDMEYTLVRAAVKDFLTTKAVKK